MFTPKNNNLLDEDNKQPNIEVGKFPLGEERSCVQETIKYELVKYFPSLQESKKLVETYRDNLTITLIFYVFSTTTDQHGGTHRYCQYDMTKK